MSKPIVKLAAVGLLGFAIWKLLPILLFPLLGGLLGLVLWFVKIAVIVGLVMLVVWLFRRNKKEGEAPAD